MPRLFSSTSLALLLTAILSTSPAFSQPPISSQSSDNTRPPANQRSVLTAVGRGSQIYICHQVKKQYQWVFVAPVARLFAAAIGEVPGEQQIGNHGDGPIWTNYDGSSIQGQLLAKHPSSDPGSIPWLLLKAVAPTGKGILSSVEFIRRSDTQGGIAPLVGCNSAHLGDLTRVSYTALYTFYSSAQR